MPKKIAKECWDCGVNLSHKDAEQRRCFVGRACISKRSRYRNRANDLARQAAANQRRKNQSGSSRRIFNLPVVGHRPPANIQIILYRDTKESAIHAATAKVWDDGMCVAEVEPRHTIGVHQRKLRAMLNEWKSLLQLEYGDKGEVKIVDLSVADCPLCRASDEPE